MSDYNKLTVVQIRELFKTRGIPATGLSKKAQLIQKLEEVDAADAQKNESSAAQDQDAGALDASGAAVAQSQESHVESGKSENIGDAGTAPTAEDFAPVAPEAAPAVAEPPPTAGPAEISAPAVEQAPAAVPSDPTVEAPVLPHVIPSKETPLEQPQPVSIGSSQAASVASSPAGDELRKRKRRSPSPTASATEVAIKKARHDENGGGVHLKEDESPKPPKAETELDAALIPKGEKAVEPADFIKYEEKRGASPDTKDGDGMNVDSTSLPAASHSETQEPPTPTKPSTNENMYKELFSRKPDLAGPPTPADNDEERTVAPSLHPATRALYIRELMRPILPATLKSHLVSLSRRHDPDEEPPTLEAFHLDAIRTHAFAVFPTIAAAARTRTALHDRVWPAERDRKPLWVDFVPETHVPAWIERELANAGPGARGAAATRWEVAYETGADGAVVAELREAGRRPPVLPDARRPSTTAAPAAPAPVPEPVLPPSFRALDARFKSTAAKPKLYWQPVGAQLAERRREELSAKYSRRPLGGSVGESNRYTFEEGILVDGGPEYGLRMPRGGGPPRGGRGGYGGGYRERESDREYDGYRGRGGGGGGYYR